MRVCQFRHIRTIGWAIPFSGTRRDEAVPFVPAEAVTYFVGITKVFVVTDGKAEERLVKPGARQGSWIEIVEGVKPGETIATTNLSQLFNGAPVTVVQK